jgi:two-component system NtrC family sensor kinase
VSGELILLVEDNGDIRRSIEEAILKPAGYSVHSVGDGMSALALIGELQPDLVLTDYRMPNLTGLELIKNLQQDFPEVPAILMTSDATSQLVLESMRAGAVDFLTKPFEAEHLLSAVGRAVKRGRRLQDLQRVGEKTHGDAKLLERRLYELETLALVGRTVTALLEIDTVLTTVVEAAVKLTGAEEGSLLLLDEESGELYMRASQNFDEDFASTFRLHVRDSLAGQVMEMGEPMLLDERSPQKIKTAYLVHSLIYVPLQVRGKTIGVLGVDNRKAGRVLCQDDVTVMTAMADYAAIAIENAQLYNRTEAERSKLETILTQTENGVIVVDNENRLLLINYTAREAFNINEDFIGRSVVEAFDEPLLLELLRSPGPSTRRDEITLSDGRVFNLHRTPIPGVGQSLLMYDITHLKKLDRIKSEFVTTVSHDLRSPLTAILGYIELVDQAGPLTDQQQEFVHRVRLSVEQISRLVADLLDLGRIEAGLDTRKEDTPISVLARYALQGLASTAKAKKITLQVDLQEKLPLVHGDPIRLRQVIANLLENALKYTPPGGRVVLDAHVEDDQIIICISDTGPGIPPADQPYLFDKFFRASNVPEEARGTGLGLSIVKSIVEQHDGRIWVESELGKGATFTVVLPVSS